MLNTRSQALQGRLDAFAARLDAVRRKCTTGYGCGSTCITVKKECRSEGGAAISKERISRLEQLAKGEIKPRGIGAPKPAEAEAMAEGLRGARSSKAQGLVEQRKAARAARAAAEAAKAAKPAAGQGELPGMGASARKGNPRAGADTVKGSGDYEFARDSAVQNAGEDLAESARHKRNRFRTIEEAEASGQVEKILTRDNLLKNFPTDLISGLNEYNVLSRLEAHYCLKAFPNLPAKEVSEYAAAAEVRRLIGETHYGKGTRLERVFNESDAPTIRKQYFDAFTRIRRFVESNVDLEPGVLRKELQAYTSKIIYELRQTEGTGYNKTYADPYNPVANALINLQKRMKPGLKTGIWGQMTEFATALSRSGSVDKTDARGTMERAVEPAKRILEGASLNEAFGQKGTSGKWRFTPAEHYVGHATRSGGRKVGGTPEAATETIIKGLGFRGLQYGNSVTDDERQHHVQKAAEALVDLADAIGLPDTAIGLNGTLGLAIGARGRGGAVAHYEPDLKVINLTRKNGVGSLSHEWGHALDNYAAGGTRFLTGGGGTADQSLSVSRLKNAWRASGFTRQCYDTIRAVKKAGGMLTESYWLSDVEMFARSFEAHVSLKLAKEGRGNTYLTRELHDGGMVKANQEKRPGDGLWPSREQAEAMEPFFDDLIAILRTEKFPGPTNRNDSRDERIWRFMHAMAGASR